MNLKDYKEEKPHLFRRLMWRFINVTLFRLIIGGPYTKRIRNALLRLFGAEISKDACVYSTADVFAPWNLKLGRACIGPHVCVYNKDKIEIGDDSVVSQGSFLCSAGHGIDSLMLPLRTAPIVIGNNVWVAAEAYVGPGVTIGDGGVVGARAAVFKVVEPWTVVGGNPAVVIKKRVIKDE